MGRRWVQAVWGIGCLALIECNGTPSPAPVRPPTGGPGPVATGGSGGTVSTSLCPPHPDCCFTPANYYCFEDHPCHGYAEIDCGTTTCGDPCLFGCEGGFCLPDPNQPASGGIGGGGGTGPGGQGGEAGSTPP